MATTGKSVKPRVQKVRRIVTGVDKKGRSIIASDKPSPHVMALQGIPTFGVTDIWRTASTPAATVSRVPPCSWMTSAFQAGADGAKRGSSMSAWSSFVSQPSESMRKPPKFGWFA